MSSNTKNTFDKRSAPLLIAEVLRQMGFEPDEARLVMALSLTCFFRSRREMLDYLARVSKGVPFPTVGSA